MSWVSAVGSLFSSAGNYASAERSWKHQKEYAQNAHQWEVEDLKKAGLNPILSAGGSGAPMTSAPMAHYENPLTEWSATKLAKKQADADIKQKESNSRVQNATADQVIQQTGLERDVFAHRVREAKAHADIAEQNLRNLKEMPAVYRSQVYSNNSAGRRNEVDSRRGEAEMPFWETAGEVVHSAVDYGKRFVKGLFDDDKPKKIDNSYSRRSGFIAHLDRGGTVANYK